MKKKFMKKNLKYFQEDKVQKIWRIIANNEIKLLNNIISNISKKDFNIKFQLLESCPLIYNLFKMKYKINPGKREIKIFGEKFVENNTFNCIILYKNEKLILSKALSIKNIKNLKKDELYLI